MNTPRFLLALSLCALLASCDDSSTSSGPGGSSTGTQSNASDTSSATDTSGTRGTAGVLVGAWAYDSANERTVQTFTADRIHEGEYLNKCLIQETWGSYEFAGGTIKVKIDSVHMRNYFTMDNDSASTCALPMSDAGASGSMSYRLENVTATSFTSVTMWFSSENGKTTSGILRHTFVKQ